MVASELVCKGSQQLSPLKKPTASRAAMQPRQISQVFVFADAQLPESLSMRIPFTAETQDLQ